MYAAYFGFSELPFNITPDPRFLYLNGCYQEALAALTYGIDARKGFISVVGEAGTGKTTLLRRLLDTVGPSTRTVLLLNPTVSFDEILEHILTELGIPTEGGRKLALLQRLNEFLLEHTLAGGNVALLIDEAQDLGVEVLEELRLLSNLETAREKILQIVLAGQPELDAKLADPRLRQLRQRVTLPIRIRTLSPAEVIEYVRTRLERVGCRDADLLPPAALERVAALTHGIPRLVNLLCDASLLAAFITEKRQVTPAIVEDAWRDFAGEAGFDPPADGRGPVPPAVETAAPPAPPPVEPSAAPPPPAAGSDTPAPVVAEPAPSASPAPADEAPAVAPPDKATRAAASPIPASPPAPAATAAPTTGAAPAARSSAPASPAAVPASTAGRTVPAAGGPHAAAARKLAAPETSTAPVAAAPRPALAAVPDAVPDADDAAETGPRLGIPLVVALVASLAMALYLSARHDGVDVIALATRAFRAPAAAPGAAPEPAPAAQPEAAVAPADGAAAGAAVAALPVELPVGDGPISAADATAVVSAFQAAIEARSPERLASLFLENAAENGLRGRAAIADGYRRRLAQLPEVHWEVAALAIASRGDAVEVSAPFVISYRRADGGRGEVRGEAEWQVERHDGRPAIAELNYRLEPQAPQARAAR
jgi:type II secretory pathway predicted ATPase ExeA